jgi:hypothetical protein
MTLRIEFFFLKLSMLPKNTSLYGSEKEGMASPIRISLIVHAFGFAKSMLHFANHDLLRNSCAGL